MAPGERVGLVGPSGSGKTLTARLACLPPPPDVRLDGTVRVHGRTGLLAQESATALEPNLTVGRQLGFLATRARVSAVLDELALPGGTAARLPGELSGGQRQRVALALALLGEPDLLVADEPTSSLDPVTALEVVEAVRRALDLRGAGLLLVTHDPGIAAALCDRIVEIGRSAPVKTPRPAPGSTTLRAAGNARPHQHRTVVAWESVTRRWQSPAGSRGVDAVTLRVRAGEHVAVLGASGAGKSTLVRLAEGREKPETGTVVVPGSLQAVPQDAGGSLTPWFSVERLLGEVVSSRAGARRRPDQRIDELLDLVRLPRQVRTQRASRLSGGQRQRVAIARALAADPTVLVGDEMLSALDPPTRAGVADAVRDHADAHGITLVVTTHDLATAARIADRVVVLCNGRVVDDGPTGLLTGSAVRPPGSPALEDLLSATRALAART